MSLLGQVILLGISGIDERGLEPVVVQEPGVVVVQVPAAAALYLMGEGRGVGGAYDLGRTGQFPERVLQPLLQGQKGLASNHLGVASPGMAQHHLEQQVAVAPAADGYSQRVAVGEVELRLAAWWMFLGEMDLLLRTVECPHPELTEGHSIIVVALSLPAASPRSRGRISSCQTPSKCSGRVRHRRSCLVSEGNGPPGHFRADRSLIPAMAATICLLFLSFHLSLHQ